RRNAASSPTRPPRPVRLLTVGGNFVALRQTLCVTNFRGVHFSYKTPKQPVCGKDVTNGPLPVTKRSVHFGFVNILDSLCLKKPLMPARKAGNKLGQAPAPKARNMKARGKRRTT